MSDFTCAFGPEFQRNLQELVPSFHSSTLGWPVSTTSVCLSNRSVWGRGGIVYGGLDVMPDILDADKSSTKNIGEPNP